MYETTIETTTPTVPVTRIHRFVSRVAPRRTAFSQASAVTASAPPKNAT